LEMLEEEEDSHYLRFVGIALVVIKKGQQYASVEEHTGWYLPAGRVDYGESFTVGAIRETEEEAGIPVRLTGIYRVEQYAMRMRIIFGAEPIDDTPLKTIPDSETLKAEWVTIEELKKKKLRHKEVLNIFKWVDDGAPLYPLGIYEGENGKEIDNKNVVSKTLHTTKVVVKKENLFLAIQKDSKIQLISQIMDGINARQHTVNATKLIAAHKLPVTLSGLYKVEHTPPQTRADPRGTITIIYSTTGAENISDLSDSLLWTESHKFSDEKERNLLLQISEGQAPHAPLDIITLEGEVYS